MLLHAVFFVILIGYATASDESNLTQIIDLNEEHTTWKGRISSVDTSSPVARYFRQNPDADYTIGTVFDYIEKLWDVVASRRKNNDSRACNIYSTVVGDWPFRMTTRVKTFQIGEIDSTCFSKVDLRAAIRSREFPRGTTRNLRKLFADSRRLTTEAFHKLKIVPDGNWPSDGKPYNLTFLTKFRSGQTCTIDTIFAHQQNRTWFLRAGVTNAPINESKPDFERQFMEEFFPRNGTHSLQMDLRNIKTDKREEATTIVERWSTTGYAIEDMNFDDPLSPLTHAYQRNLVAIDLASDAITISNVAILALPMVMNLIPIAFLADFHTFGMFMYIVVTDVFSTIPFFIKGVELIHSSQPTQEEVFAFFSGNEALGSMQSWVVQCKGEQKFRNVGIVFVVASLGAAVMGVALELWAKRYMYWKRARAKDPKDVIGPFGTMALEYDTEDMSFYDNENEHDSKYAQSKRRRIPDRARRYIEYLRK